MAAIQKINRRLNRWKSLFSRKLAGELNISRSSIQRIFKNDRELQVYNMKKEPFLTDDDREKRMKIANCL